MSRGPTLAEVLAARDARSARQSALLADARSVVSLTLVTPGPDKTPAWAAAVFAEALTRVHEVARARGWGIVGEDVRPGAATGPEGLLALRADPAEVKGAMIELEDGHPAGRLWDLDVLSVAAGAAGPAAGAPGPLTDGTRARVWTRADLGLPPRACLLCGEPAAACARSQRHDVRAVADAARERAASWRAAAAGHDTPYALLAHRALLVEVRHTPKPGLVDRRNNGAHDDMDLALFEASADAILPGLAGCERLGAASADAGPLAAAMPALRATGLAAEAAMLAATGGVNTHRGAIFAFGLVCAAAGRVRALGATVHPEAVCAEVALALREETGAPAGAGRGRFGMGGAHGAALSGYALVRELALPAYRAGLARAGREEDALAAALLTLLAHNDDTNLAARGGLEAVTRVRARATELLARRDVGSPAHRARLEAFDDELIAARWSPGGSADLLALTWFLAGLPDPRPLGARPRDDTPDMAT